MSLSLSFLICIVWAIILFLYSVVWGIKRHSEQKALRMTISHIEKIITFLFYSTRDVMIIKLLYKVENVIQIFCCYLLLLCGVNDLSLYIMKTLF